MRSKLGRKLRSFFSREMQIIAPAYLEIPSRDLPAGRHRVFMKQCDSNLYTFIMLQVNDNKDTFTIELAWSTEPRYPFDSTIMWLEFIYAEQPQRGRIRLGSLMPDGGDYWWRLAEETSSSSLAVEQLLDLDLDLDEDINKSLARVDAVGKEALAAIKDYAIPFLDRIEKLPSGKG